MATPSITTVGTTAVVGFPGGPVDTGPHDTVSAINESATALDFGQVCVRGVAVAAGLTQNIKPQTADGDAIFGVTEGSAVDITADSSNVINYPRYADVPVRRKGRIYVAPCEDVVAGTAAVVVTAGTGSKIASTTGGAVGAGRIAMPGGSVWETTTLSGVLGILNLNLP